MTLLEFIFQDIEYFIGCIIILLIITNFLIELFEVFRK